MRSAAFTLFIALAAVAAPAFASVSDTAESQSPQILFQPKFQFPAQGGVDVKAAFLPVGTVTLVGGRGELMVGDNLGIGVASYSLVSELVPTYSGVKHDIGLSYGGLLLNYSFYPRRLFYFNTALLMGLGQASSVARENNADRVHSAFPVLEPELDWMVNVTRELRLGLCFSWRFFPGSSEASTVGMDLQGPAATLSMLYGKI